MKRHFAKLDPGFYSNRKIIRAGRNGREVFLFLLCLNVSKGGLAGSVTERDAAPWYVADQLRINESDANDGISQCVTAELIEIRDGRIWIVGWDQEWSRAVMTDAERAKAYRQRQKGSDRHETNVTNHVTSDASPNRSEESRERDARDAREETLSQDPQVSESQSDSGSSSRSHARSARPGRVRTASSLPADWIPSDEGRRQAQALGLDLGDEVVKFRSDALSQGKTSHNWNASFDTWLRRGADWLRRNGRTKSQPKPGQYTTERRRSKTVILAGVAEMDEETEPT